MEFPVTLKPRFIPSQLRIQEETAIFKERQLDKKRESKPQIAKEPGLVSVLVIKCKDIGLDINYEERSL